MRTLKIKIIIYNKDMILKIIFIMETYKIRNLDNGDILLQI